MTSHQRGGSRLWHCPAAALFFSFCLTAAHAGDSPAPEAAPAAAAPAQPAGSAAPAEKPRESMDMSGILGAGSQLEAGPEGEFFFTMGEDGQLDTFRAVRDIILLTDDINMSCHELVYGRADGKITATAAPGQLVHIRMRSMNPGAGGQQGGGDVRATCEEYEFMINENRHILNGDGAGKPVIYQKNEKGEEYAISGNRIVMTQRETGAWRMDVKGFPEIFNPKEKHKLAEERQRLMNPTAPRPAPQPKPSPSVAPAVTPQVKPPATPDRRISIDEGGSAPPSRPPRQVKIDEGGE
jgi:hypothetical protein